MKRNKEPVLKMNKTLEPMLAGVGALDGATENGQEERREVSY